MAKNIINLKLRPIKLGFVLDPKNKDSLLKVIEINSALWGGMYNPIIPMFKRRPSKWERYLKKQPSPKEIFEGYLNFYDPDYVVQIG